MVILPVYFVSRKLKIVIKKLPLYSSVKQDCLAKTDQENRNVKELIDKLQSNSL